ncbi:MAG: adenylate/guanylate cyclase domain-containing protein [Anaerolineaceae bacterium]|nr:adenylate/guanylate cyclase domain-containing protein [Anaerolineaceae bacterium]
MVLGKLVLIVSGKDNREFILEKPTVTIGRSPENDVVLTKPEVSRHHARLVLQPNPIIEDTGSTLGTVVNGKKISSSYPLHSGDIITIGGLQLRFELPHPEKAAQRPVVANVEAAAPPKLQPTTSKLPGSQPLASSVLSKLLGFLYGHIIPTLAILFSVGMLLILLNLYNLALQINKDAAENYAAVFVQSLDKFRNLYSTDVVNRVQNHGILVTSDYANHEGAIPIPSTLGIEISQQISEPGSAVQARLYSDFPFPTRKDGGPHTDFETEALVTLRVEPDKSVPYIAYTNINGRLSLEYAHAVIMEQDCVVCHNSAPDSPKKDWKVGDVGGVQEVVLPIDSAFSTIRKGLLTTLGVMLIITVVGLGLLALALSALQKSILMLSRTNTAYARFVPGEFLSLLGKQNIIDVALADNVQMEMTVLFSDIRSFTTISEGMDAQKNFQFLSGFMSKMGPIVRKNHGFIDKYFGDAIMAVFQSPDDALDAAIALNQELTEYNRVRQSNLFSSIDIGIGLNTGKVTLGTLGEQDRMDGTVVSDAVNLASRIEGMTKIYEVTLVISERTFRGLKDADRFAMRLLDRVRVKGKTDPVTIYEVFSGDTPDVLEKKIATKRDFEQAIGLYQLKQFQSAKSLFEKCLVIYPNDRAAKFYIERCNNFINNGIENDWDGVLNLDSK